jgi:hypothetical protein
VQFLGFSTVVPQLAAGILDRIDSRIILPFCITFVVLLIPHWIAAKVLAPRPTVWLVIAALFSQLVFGIMSFLAGYFIFAGTGPQLLAICGIASIVVSALINAGIYGFGVGRGFLYNILVGLVAGAMGMAGGKLMDSGVFEPLLAIVRSQEGAESGRTTAVAIASPHYANAQEAQTAAVQRYPALGVGGSAFNQRFLEKHRRYQSENASLFTSPDWPIIIADEVAAELSAN